MTRLCQIGACRFAFAALILIVIAGINISQVAAQQPPTAKPSEREAKPSGKSEAAEIAASIDPAKLADIQRLFEVSGAKKNIHELLGGMLSGLKPQIAMTLPPGKRTETGVGAVLEKLRTLMDSEEFFIRLAKIYDTYFTREDIQGLIKFYESPAGKHFAAVMPQMTQQFVQSTQQWVVERAPKMIEEILQEHPELKQETPVPGGDAGTGRGQKL